MTDDAGGQFLGRIRVHAAQECPCQVGEERLHQVEPRAVGGSENELEAIGRRGRMGAGLLGDMGRMIVEDGADLPVLRIGGLDLLQARDELSTAVTGLDAGQDVAVQEIDPTEQRESAVADVFGIALHVTGRGPEPHQNLCRGWADGLEANRGEPLLVFFHGKLSLTQATEEDMPAAARTVESNTSVAILHVAFELGAKDWKLGFTTGLGRAPRVRKIAAGNLASLEREIEQAKQRFGVPVHGRVVSCYEAGRDGFWLDRYLGSRGIENYVVDSSSIEVNRRKRRRKSDRLDLRSLLRLPARHRGGEDGVWSVVHVPSVEAEDRRHLHREIATLTEERKERTNRIKSLLATQGVRLELARDFPERLREVRLWDGSALPPELHGRLEREWERRESVVEEIEALEAERLRRLRTADDDHALEQVQALMEFRGIGIKSSWLFVMEFFSWRNFTKAKQVGALAGLAPTPNQSGEVDQSPGIEKAGNVRVRRMATEIAWSWVRFQPNTAITHWFQRRFAHAGKRARRRGITAVARKVLVAFWRYLEFGEIPEGAVLSDG